jgi:hypothetical protein
MPLPLIFAFIFAAMPIFADFRRFTPPRHIFAACRHFAMPPPRRHLLSRHAAYHYFSAFYLPLFCRFAALRFFFFSPLMPFHAYIFDFSFITPLFFLSAATPPSPADFAIFFFAITDFAYFAAATISLAAIFAACFDSFADCLSLFADAATPLSLFHFSSILFIFIYCLFHYFAFLSSFIFADFHISSLIFLSIYFFDCCHFLPPPPIFSSFSRRRFRLPFCFRRCLILRRHYAILFC